MPAGDSGLKMERVIGKKRGITITAQDVHQHEVLVPDPEAPSVREIVEVLREARDEIAVWAEDDHEHGFDWSATVLQEKVRRVDALIAKLED